MFSDPHRKTAAIKPRKCMPAFFRPSGTDGRRKKYTTLVSRTSPAFLEWRTEHCAQDRQHKDKRVLHTVHAFLPGEEALKQQDHDCKSQNAPGFYRSGSSCCRILVPGDVTYRNPATIGTLVTQLGQTFQIRQSAVSHKCGHVIPAPACFSPRVHRF